MAACVTGTPKAIQDTGLLNRAGDVEGVLGTGKEGVRSKDRFS
ncbi:MAG: hypothetical protein PVG99_06360 [Desulfobacteraceae bacterium]